MLLLLLAGAHAPARAQCLRWSTAFGTNFPNGGDVYALAAFDDGSGPAMYVGGWFTYINGGPGAPYIARWNGTSWSGVGGGMSGGTSCCYGVYALTTYPAPSSGGPYLVAAGQFDYAGGNGTFGIAKWDGVSWSDLDGGLTGHPTNRVLTLLGDGELLYAGGSFNQVGAVGANNIAMWNGSSWSPLGSGMTGATVYDDNVYALAIHDDGTGRALYAGGNFDFAGGVTANGIARWDGSSWHPVGSESLGVLSLAVFDDGTGPALYAGGPFSFMSAGVAKWDGTSWSAVGSGMNGSPSSLTVFDDGSGPALYAGGSFGIPGTHIAKWDGTTWSALGDGVWTSGCCGTADALATIEFPSGVRELYAGGLFGRAGAIFSYNIAAWRACDDPIESFCFGDGTVAACPCSNEGLYGHGCENSQSTGGARLYTTGSTDPDTLVLHATAELPSALSIFLQGDALISSTVPFGDGLRCAGGNLKRLYVRSAVNGLAEAPMPGDLPIKRRSLALGDPIAPGSLRYYQTYYRDPDAAFCASPDGGMFNATNGMRVVW